MDSYQYYNQLATQPFADTYTTHSINPGVAIQPGPIGNTGSSLNFIRVLEFIASISSARVSRHMLAGVVRTWEVALDDECFFAMLTNPYSAVDRELTATRSLGVAVRNAQSIPHHAQAVLLPLVVQAALAAHHARLQAAVAACVALSASNGGGARAPSALPPPPQSPAGWEPHLVKFLALCAPSPNAPNVVKRIERCGVNLRFAAAQTQPFPTLLAFLARSYTAALEDAMCQSVKFGTQERVRAGFADTVLNSAATFMGATDTDPTTGGFARVRLAEVLRHVLDIAHAGWRAHEDVMGRVVLRDAPGGGFVAVPAVVMPWIGRRQEERVQMGRGMQEVARWVEECRSGEVSKPDLGTCACGL
jgi:hypothetical protein